MLEVRVRREPQKLGKPQWSETGTPEHGCLARAPRVTVAKGSWATSTGSLTLRSGSPPPTREARLQFNRTMLLFLFELFFVSQAGFELAS